MKIYEVLKKENIGRVCVLDEKLNPWYVLNELGKTSYVIRKNGHGQISLYDTKKYNEDIGIYDEPMSINTSYIMILEFNLK